MHKRGSDTLVGQWLLLVAALLVAGGMLAVALARSHERVAAVEAERLLTAVRIADETLGLQLERVARLLRVTSAEYFGTSGGDAADQHLIESLIDATTGIREVAILDAAGNVRLASRAGLRGESLAGRADFERLKAPPTVRGPLLSMTGATATTPSRLALMLPIRGSDDVLRGAAVVTLDADYLRTLLGAARYSADLRLAIVHDGRQSPVAVPALPQAGDSGRLYAERALDVRGTEAIGEFVVAADRERDAIFEEWWGDARILLAIFVAVTATSIIVLAVFQRWQRGQEQALREAEAASQRGTERLRLATEAAGIGIWEYELPERRLLWDPSMYAVYGIDPETVEPLYVLWRDALHPEDLAATEMALAEAIAGVRPLDLQYRIRRGDGRLRWIRSRAQMREPAGETRRLIGTSEDVTDRVETAQALQQHEHDLQSILDNMPARIAYWDRQLQNRFANQAFHVWFGQEPGQLVGRTFREVVGEERYRFYLPYIEGVLRGEAQVFQSSTRSPVGKNLRQTLTHYIPDLNGDTVTGFYVLISDITAIKDAESALREKEERLRAIFDILPVGIAIADRDGRVIDFNRGADLLLGVHPESLLPGSDGGEGYAIRGSDGQVMSPDDTPNIRAARERRPVLNVEMQVSGPRGRHWFSVSAMPLVAPEGAMVVAYVDVTERRDGESALAESEARYRALATVAPVGMWRADGEGNCIYVNERWLQLTGISEQQAYGPGWADALHPDDRSRVSGEWMAAVRDGLTFASEYRFGSGADDTVWVLGRAVPELGPEGRVISYVGTLTDITIRKRAEMSLADSQSMLATIIDSAMDAVITVDDQYRVRIFNRSAELMFGYRAEQMIGQPIERLMPLRFRADHGRHMARFAGVESNTMRPMAGGSRRRDVQALRADGTEFPIEASISHMTAAGRRVFSIVVRDLTERRRAESRLIELNENLEARVDERTLELERAKDQAEAASRAKSEFLANMSHEIRTPLNTVLGMVHLVLLGDLNAKQRDYVEKIGTSGTHLLGLINDILDFSKIEAGKLELDVADFDIGGTLDDLVRTMQDRAQAKGLALGLDVAEDVPRRVRGDALRLEQILINLVGNAIKFTDSGSIRVRVRCGETWSQGLRLHVEVEDNGIGMSAETQRRLFRSFEQADSSTTRKFGGTGLGLAICKRLVELMGGQIGVRSEVGTGSCFWFAVPLEQAAHQDQAALPPVAGSSLYATIDVTMAALRGKRILVADDHPFNQQVMMGMLESVGAQVCLAVNGKEVLDLLRQERFDCILMDVQMPEMDGYEATRRVRADPQWRDLPILALTANASREDRERCLASGMSDFLTKPIHPDTLYAALHRWLAAAGATPAPGATAVDSAGKRHATAEVVTAGGAVAEGRKVDLGVLAKIVGDSVPTIRKFADRFLDSARTGLADIERGLAADDLPAMAAAGHRLKSVARTVGAFDFAGICSKIEGMKNQGSVADARVLVDEARAMLVEIERELPLQLEALAAPPGAPGPGVE